MPSFRFRGSKDVTRQGLVGILPCTISNKVGEITEAEIPFPSPPQVAQEPLVGQGLLIIGASQSHSDTPHLVELLWTSDQPAAENST